MNPDKHDFNVGLITVWYIWGLVKALVDTAACIVGIVSVNMYIKGFKPTCFKKLYRLLFVALFFVAYFAGMIIRNTFFGVKHYHHLIDDDSIISWMVTFTDWLRESEKISWIFDVLNEVCHYEFGFVALLVINHFGSLHQRSHSVRSRMSSVHSLLGDKLIQESGGSNVFSGSAFLEQGGLKSFNESGLTVDENTQFNYSEPLTKKETKTTK